MAVLPLPGGEFYHYGTSPEIISSTLAIQNLVNDQREIMHHSRKPHPAMFIQNAITEAPITENNQNLWVENSFVGRKWVLSHEHIITGVPENDWDIHLRPNDCIDMVPVGEKEFVVRPYGFNDPFRGGVDEETTLFLGRPLRKWAEERRIVFDNNGDIQQVRLFPVTDSPGRWQTLMGTVQEDEC